MLSGLSNKYVNFYFCEQVRKQEEAARARLLEREKSRRLDLKPSLPLSEYAGRYVDSAYGTASISVENGALVWQWSTFNNKLKRFQADTFTIDNDLLGHP